VSGVGRTGVSAFSDESWGGDPHQADAAGIRGNVSAFSDESWGGDPQNLSQVLAALFLFQHSLMNLGVETRRRHAVPRRQKEFQHSLMNLGVETSLQYIYDVTNAFVSAFSDESWGGDHNRGRDGGGVGAFQHSLMNLGVETCPLAVNGFAIFQFQHSLMNLGVET